MTRFYYKATTRTGQIHTGEMDAVSAEEVHRRVRATGMIPFEVVDATQAVRKGLRDLNIKSLFRGRKRVKAADVLMFTEKFAVLLRSGLPLDRSLSLMIELSEQENVRVVAEALLKDINSGLSLADSMAKHPHFFSNLYVSMIRAGEAAGVVDRVMEQLLDYLQEREELKSFVVSSLVYPALLLVVGIGTIIVMIAFVIPKFQEIFETLDQELPGPTQAMLAVSDFVLAYKYLIILLIAAIIFGYRYWVSTPEGRARKDRIMLKLPVIRNLIVDQETGRMAATAGILLTSAVPLIQTLNIIKDLMNNTVFRDAMLPVVAGARKGDGVSGPMLKTGVFPALAVHLIKVGEESGKLGEMFLKVGQIYRETIRKSVKAFLSLFEPILILGMGLVVGLIVASMMLAMFSLNEAPF